jgi:hypothetical protein
MQVTLVDAESLDVICRLASKGLDVFRDSSPQFLQGLQERRIIWSM